MRGSSFIVRRWKLLLNIVTLVALALVIYATRHQIGSTVSNLGKVNAWALLLIIPVEALNYHAQTKLYQRLFRMVGNDLSYKFLYRASLELNFVNHVFPSGGVTGISYFGLRMRKKDQLTAGKATLVQFMKLGLYYAAFEILIVVAVIALTIMGHENRITIFLASVLSTLMIVGTGLFIYIVGSTKRIDAFFSSVTRLINRLIRFIRPSHPETIKVDAAKQAFQDFHNSYLEIKSNYKELKGPFWYAFLADLTEVLAIYVVYIAFGHLINIGAVILAYAVANVAGLVSILPGGIGIYEALMTAVLATTGVSAGVSLPVTVMYRVINTLIQVPPGYYLYQKTLRSSPNLGEV